MLRTRQELAAKWLGHAMPDGEVAEQLGISKRTLRRWRAVPEFRRAICDNLPTVVAALLDSADEPPRVLSQLKPDQMWAVAWLARGQTLAWTVECSRVHLFRKIERSELVDWMRRWWFLPALREAIELQGWGWDTLRIRVKPSKDDEPPTRWGKVQYELKKDRKLRKYIERSRKRLETLRAQPGGIARMVAPAHAGLRKAHRARAKPPGWRPGMPWKGRLRVGDVVFDTDTGTVTFM